MTLNIGYYAVQCQVTFSATIESPYHMRPPTCE